MLDAAVSAGKKDEQEQDEKGGQSEQTAVSRGLAAGVHGKRRQQHQQVAASGYKHMGGALTAEARQAPVGVA